MRRIVAALLVATVLVAIATPAAEAGGRHGHGAGVIGLAAFALFAPLIIAGEVLAHTVPRPVVVAPAPVYAPAPAYYSSPPPYYAPAPAYSSPPAYWSIEPAVRRARSAGGAVCARALRAPRGWRPHRLPVGVDPESADRAATAAPLAARSSRDARAAAAPPRGDVVTSSAARTSCCSRRRLPSCSAPRRTWSCIRRRPGRTARGSRRDITIVRMTLSPLWISTVELPRVLADDLPHGGRRQVPELLLDVLRGLRPDPIAVGIVRAPHERVLADLVNSWVPIRSNWKVALHCRLQ